MFKDRSDAGRKLGQALVAHRSKGAVVLAIPRGGVEVGDQVARSLGADFSLVVVRKLPFPDNPEAGFGALAEDGSLFLVPEYRGVLPPDLVQEVLEQQAAEVARRVLALRGGEPLPQLSGRTVILVDDGIAIGSTMRAAVALARKARAARVVVAAPVSSAATARVFAALADEAVVLETPPHFRAVAESYRDWYDVPDSEVVAIMRRRRDPR